HTRFSRDWSSDVCSSDLEDLVEDADLVGVGLQFALTDDVIAIAAAAARESGFHPCGQAATRLHRQVVQEEFVHRALQPDVNPVEIGSASCRGSVYTSADA